MTNYSGGTYRPANEVPKDEPEQAPAQDQYTRDWAKTIKSRFKIDENYTARSSDTEFVYGDKLIDAYNEFYKGQGQQLDPAWVEQQQQLSYDYHMSSPVQPNKYYWENTQNVGRWAALMDNLPGNVQPPVWMDRDTIGKAAKYFSDLNGGTPWYEWAPISPNDPARMVLRQMQAPDESDLPNWETSQNKQNEAIQRLASTETPAPNSAGFLGDYKEGLPAWQYPIIAVTSQVGQVGQGMLGGALVGGSFAGPVGAVVGGTGGGVVSYLAGEEAKKQAALEAGHTYETPFWINALNALDWMASQVEKGIGTAQQLLADPAATLANLPAAYEAGQFSYNVTDLTNPGELNTPLMDVLAGTPLAPAIQAARLLNKGKVAQTEVWELGQAKASDIWVSPDGKAPSDYALTTIRNNIASGTWTTDQAAQFVYSKFGITGETRDLVGHIALDPLNISGLEVSKGIKRINKAAIALGKGSKAAELAVESFGSGRTLLDDVRMYTHGARTRTTVAEAAALPTFTKILAGLTDAGMPKDHLNAAQTKNAIERFFSLNPYSKATQMHGQFTEGVALLLQNEPTMDGKIALLKSLAAVDTQSAVNAWSKVGKITTDIGGVKIETDIPKYWQSPEGQSVVLALKNAVPEIDKIAEQYKFSSAKRTLIEDIAKTHPDYATLANGSKKLISDLEKLDAKGKTVFIERWKQGLAASDDPVAKQYLDLVTTNRIGAAQLTDAIKPFENGKPFHDAEFSLALTDAVGQKVAQYAADYFGVKPDPLLIRMSKLTKTIQTYLVLGYNPTYLASNWLSNAVHLAYGGLLDNTSLIGRDAFMTAFYGDAIPTRYKAGMGSAELGELGGKPISGGIQSAARADDLIQKAHDFLTLPKDDSLKSRIKRHAAAPFVEFSQNAEKWASEVAMIHGIREYWGQFWEAGKGFDKIRTFDPQLADILDTMIPGGTKKIEAMIKRGMNRAQIEGEMFKGFASKSIDDVISQTDQNLVNAFPDVFDAAKKAYNKAPTESVREAVMLKLPQDFIRAVSDKLSEQTKNAFHEMIAKINIDGSAQGLTDKIGEIMGDRNGYYNEHLNRLQDLYEEAATMPAAEARNHIDQGLQLERITYDAYNIRHQAEWLGMVKAMGGGENVPKEWMPVLDILKERDTEWSTFFLEREDSHRATWDKYQELKAVGGQDAEISRIWSEHFEKMNSNYAEMTGWEHMINKLFGEMSGEQVQAKQPEFLDGYRTWIDNQHAVRLQAMATELLYRSGKLPQYNAAGMADAFIKQHPGLERWKSFIHAAADEMASTAVPPEITAKIFELTRGQPEYKLGQKERKTAAVEYAKIRDAYSVLLMEAKNQVPDVQPKVKPPVPPVDPKAKVIPPPASAATRNVKPIYDAFEAAAKEVGEEGYFRNKNGNMIIASHVAAAVEEQAPGMGKKIMQLTQEQLDQVIEGWKKKHLDAQAEAKAKQAVPEAPKAEEPTAPVEPEVPKVVEPEATPVDYEAESRARIIEAERETSYKLADKMGEFAYGRKDLETAMRKLMPDKAATMLTLFDSLAEYFNPELKMREFYDRLGWKTGGKFEEGGGLRQFSKAPKNEHQWSTLVKDYFGTTNTIREAGYILPDGTMLDLTGRHSASGYERKGDRWVPEKGTPDYLKDSRSVDHRELPNAIKVPPHVYEWSDSNNNSATMLYFLSETGAVRIDHATGMITIGGKGLTDAQARIIQDNFNSGWIEVDDPRTGLQIWDKEFDKGGRNLRNLLQQADTIAKGEKEPPQGLFQSNANPVWYSQLQRTVEAIPQERMTVGQLKAAIQKGGVKPDEMKWTGLDEWLAERGANDKITKAEVAEFLKQNEVVVEEKVLGFGGNDVGNSTWIALDVNGNMQAGSDDPTHLNQTMIKNGWKQDQFRIERAPARPTQYQNYTIPGGENNRELLFKLPVKETYNTGTYAIYIGDTQLVVLQTQDAANAYVAQHPNAGLTIRNVLSKTAPHVDFTSPHFGKQGENLVAHARFNDRIDADGKRVLFIEEVQSDWHQAGREHGYRTDETSLVNQSLIAKQMDGYWEVNTESGQFVTNVYGSDAPTADIAITEARRRLIQNPLQTSLSQDQRVPSAPFSKTTAWSELVMKRMIRWAAENGYDRVAWPTGKMQADRYNLAKQVENITWARRSNGNYDLTINLKRTETEFGDRPITGENMTAKELADNIGKDAAQRIVDSPGEKTSYQGYEATGILAGEEDLAVGDQDMKTSYDEILPNTVNKYVKKWGAKVGETQIKAGDNRKVLYTNGVISGMTENTATDTVHSFDVTPQMKESVMQGQPLFEKNKGTVHGLTAFTTHMQAAIRAYDSANMTTFAHEIIHGITPVMQKADADIVRTEFNRTHPQTAILPEDWHTRMIDAGDGKLTAEYVDAYEWLSRGFERYLANGKSPTAKLREVFKNIKAWMLNIYGQIKGSEIDVPVSDAVHEMFSKWLGKEPELKVLPLTDAGRAVAGSKLSDIAQRAQEQYAGWKGKEAQTKPFTVDETLIVNNPNAGFDTVVSYRGPSGPDKSMVYDPKTGAQFTANNDWLRRPETQPAAQPPQMARKPVQETFFQQGEDTPLFSGTPMKAQEQSFNPPDVSGQDALFPRGEYMQTIGSKKAGEAEPIEVGLFQRNEASRNTYALGNDPNTRYEFTYKLVDLDQLIASHTDTLEKNPAFPKELQPRERGRAASQMQVQQIAAELQPDALLTDFNQLDRGAMIIGPDRVVESGNGRVMALRKARVDYPERWQDYQTALRSKLSDFGMSEADLEGMANPVLVRERVSNVDRVKFVNEANESATMRMSALETAANDAALVRDNTLTNLNMKENWSIEQTIRSRDNADFVRSFVDALPENERATVMDSKGELSASGVQRIKNALFAHVFPGEAGQRLAQIFIESPVKEVANIQNALFTALPSLARAEAMIRNGTRAPGLSIVDDLAKAVDVYARLKQQNLGVGEYLSQNALFEQELDPFQQSMLKYIDTNVRSTKKLTGLFAGYADVVISSPDPNQIDLFGGIPRAGRGELLDAAGRKAGQTTDFAEAEIATAPPAGQVLAGGQAQEPQAPAQAKRQVTPPPDLKPIAAQAGTADSLTQAPTDKANLELYLREIGPMINRWRRDLKGQSAQQNLAIGDLPKDQQLQIRRYLGKVYGQMNDVKMGATRWGEAKRDFAILDYSKRSDADTLLSAIAPYQFWYTHSMMNWALRAMDRPSIVTNYLRMQQFANREQNREGYPTRLKGKMSIPFPWMPEWAGNEIFVDVNRLTYPFLQFTRPFEKYGEQLNMVERLAMSSIDYDLENQKISATQADQAKAKQGPLWEKYYNAAEMETRGDSQETLSAPIQSGSSRNALDLAFSILAPSLPLSIGYAIATRRTDTVGLLPLTKFVKNVSGVLGANNGQGWNIEAPIRKLAGWPEQDRYADYRLDAAMAQLMADGQVTADEAKTAMIDRAGPAYLAAQKRVQQIEPLRYIGAPLGLDIFPEGEREVRALKDEYGTARNKWVAGDKKALSEFYDKYPEYDTRNFSFKTPEDRTRSYLISSVWEGYNSLNSAEKKAMGADNDLFQTAFINKDTRSYDSIDTPTLTAWAQRMKQKLPAKMGTAPVQKPLVDDKINPVMTAYDTEKKKLFPTIGSIEGMYYAIREGSATAKAFQKAHPEMDKYRAWKNDYIAAHPELAPLVTGETSKIFGLPQPVQALYYTYYSQLQHLFPGIFDKQDTYFSISDKMQKKAYLAKNKDLSNYWDWRRKFAADNPTVAPYIMSAESLAEAINPTKNESYSSGGSRNSQPQVQISANQKRTIVEHFKGGIRLDLGIESEVQKMMKSAGATGMSGDQFLRQTMGNYLAAIGKPKEDHPAILSAGEVAQLPPEFIRQLVAYKYGSYKLGSGALAQAAQFKDKFGIPDGVSTDNFIEEYLLPALQ